MVDEMYDRQYQAGRAELHDGIDRGFAAIWSGLKALHNLQWAAPWRSARLPRKDGAGLA